MKKSELRQIIREEIKKLIEKKVYDIQYNVGKSKYLVNFSDGKKTHKDGSKMYDIRTFKNKKDLNNFIQKLIKNGYTER